MNSMVKSIIMCGAERWTVTENISKKIEAFEMKCYCRLLGVAWKERKKERQMSMFGD